MSAFPKRILVRDGAMGPWETGVGSTYSIHHAESPLSAAAQCSRLGPQVVIVDARRAWHRTFVETLPRDRRPAVVAVGDLPPPGIADALTAANPWFCSQSLGSETRMGRAEPSFSREENAKC